MPMTDPQVITKAIKGLVALGAVLGIEVGEDHATAIAQGAMALYAVAYALEAWWKKKGS